MEGLGGHACLSAWSASTPQAASRASTNGGRVIHCVLMVQALSSQGFGHTEHRAEEPVDQAVAQQSAQQQEQAR